MYCNIAICDKGQPGQLQKKCTNNACLSFLPQKVKTSCYTCFFSFQNPGEGILLSCVSCQAEVLATLQQLAKNVSDSSALGIDQPLLDAGLNSLSAVEFARSISTEFQVRLPPTFAFDYPTLGSMADRLSSELATDVSDNLVADVRPHGSSILASASFELPRSSKYPEVFQGLDCVTEVPFARLDLDVYFDPEFGDGNHTYTKHAACMHSVEWFDAKYFGITLAEGKVMDPQQRLLLQAAVSANCKSLEKSQASVFVGQANHDWALQDQPATPFIGTALSPAITSNRLSYHFHLQGLSMTIDTACSSSLVALATAIRHGSLAHPAVVAATHVMLSPIPFVGSCAAKMLSRPESGEMKHLACFHLSS